MKKGIRSGTQLNLTCQDLQGWGCHHVAWNFFWSSWKVVGWIRMGSSMIMILMAMYTLMLLILGGILGGKSGFIIALILAFFMNFVTFMFSGYRRA